MAALLSASFTTSVQSGGKNEVTVRLALGCACERQGQNSFERAVARHLQSQPASGVPGQCELQGLALTASTTSRSTGRPGVVQEMDALHVGASERLGYPLRLRSPSTWMQVPSAASAVWRSSPCANARRRPAVLWAQWSGRRCCHLVGTASAVAHPKDPGIAPCWFGATFASGWLCLRRRRWTDRSRWLGSCPWILRRRAHMAYHPRGRGQRSVSGVEATAWDRFHVADTCLSRAARSSPSAFTDRDGAGHLVQRPRASPASETEWSERREDLQAHSALLARQDPLEARRQGSATLERLLSGSRRVADISFVSWLP